MATTDQQGPNILTPPPAIGTPVTAYSEPASLRGVSLSPTDLGMVEEFRENLNQARGTASDIPNFDLGVQGTTAIAQADLQVSKLDGSNADGHIESSGWTEADARTLVTYIHDHKDIQSYLQQLHGQDGNTGPNNTDYTGQIQNNQNYSPNYNANYQGADQNFTETFVDKAVHGMWTFSGSDDAIRGDRIPNEDGNDNESLQDLAGHLNDMEQGRVALNPQGTVTPFHTSGGTFGTGPDTLTVTLSEDAWKGDAQANITLDGQVLNAQPLAVTAQNSTQQDETFTFKGNFGSTQHVVGVYFLNDAYAGTPDTDRNLHVQGATLDGQAATGENADISGTAQPASGTVELYSTGDSDTLTLPGDPVAAPSAPTPTTPTPTAPTPTAPAPVTVGSGPDAIALGISEDSYQGDAQFTVSVDGKQIGGTLTASVLHNSGQDQAFNIMGKFGAGQHTVGVSFLNDAYGGSADTDRNLYVDSASYKGQAASGLPQGIYWSDGPHSFQV